jgi:hypothetical protein
MYGEEHAYQQYDGQQERRQKGQTAKQKEGRRRRENLERKDAEYKKCEDIA